MFVHFFVYIHFLMIDIELIPHSQIHGQEVVAEAQRRSIGAGNPAWIRSFHECRRR